VALDVPALERQLRSEGFVHTYVWQDEANAFYEEHTHDCETAHIILEGRMTLGQRGETRSYNPGERCDVPAGVLHWARMGPAGCRYLIGER
jgi:mannose-6-phosphate isomerase-like protein (cupin superfamily)